MLLIYCYTRLNIVTDTCLTVAVKPVLEIGRIVCSLKCVCPTG
jgi:hypothetical protein